MGFDQMMSFYNHYTVFRSRCKVVLQNTSTTLTPSVGIMLSGSNVVTSSIEQTVENGDLVFAALGYAGAQGSMSRLSRSCNCAEFQGIDDIMDDSAMRGDAASNPVEQMYYHVIAWNPFTATQVTVYYQVVIEYDAVFHEPRKGPIS